MLVQPRACEGGSGTVCVGLQSEHSPESSRASGPVEVSPGPGSRLHAEDMARGSQGFGNSAMPGGCCVTGEETTVPRGGQQSVRFELR